MAAVDTTTPAALKQRIDDGDPTTVVDVRNPHAFDEWHIDGDGVHAVNLPANRLQTMDLEAELADAPKDEVVAVCASGQSSRMAVRALERAGIGASNLQYGMNGWANLYLDRELATEGDATVLQFQRPSSGCLSYMVVAGGEAAVIDPLLAFADRYQAVADEHDATLSYALDTHVHADHVSGVRALARRSNATAVVPAAAEDRGIDYGVAYETVADGETLQVGDAAIEAVHTPGHTTGMTAYAHANVLFTGDGLFTESVARPDLEAGNEGAADMARTLHDSLQSAVLTRPDDTVIAPAHFSDSAEQAPDGTYTATVGELAAAMDALSMPTEQFVDYVTADMPPRPSNHERIIDTNLGQRDTPQQVALQMELGPNNCAASEGSMAD